MNTSVRTVTHASGERVPLLFSQTPFQPLLLPLLWVTLERRNNARATIDKDIRALKRFYDYCARLEFDLEQAFLEREFEAVLEHFERFAYWIKGKSKSNKIIPLNAPETFLRAATVNAYLSSIKLFLLWNINRYISPRFIKTEPPHHVLRYKESLLKQLERLLGSHVLPVKFHDKIQGLNLDQIQKIRSYIEPENPENPYPTTSRVRNWLIFNLLLETGMRRSELLKLKTIDVQEINGRYFISLTDRTDDPEDTRKHEPGFKTLERTIELSEYLYNVVDEYVDFFRRPTDKKGNLKKLQHQYLVTNYRGQPLSLKSVNEVFKAIKVLPDLSEISPRILRNTFANEFLEFLVEQQGNTLEEAQDQLRYIGGWSTTSPMPQKYGRKYIAKLANKMNRQRIDSAWERVRNYE